MSNWNLKDNLAIDNNKYLKLLGPTGLVTNSILGIDTIGNLNINSALSGDIYLNSNNSVSNTFINVNNLGNTFIQSKLSIGINSTSNINSTINLPSNGYIGLNTTTGTNNGFLAIVGGSSLLNTVGSRILLFGNDNTSGNSGQLNLYSGNTTTGNIQLYTANDSLKLQILNNGTSNFQPDGTTIRLSISNINTMITNPLIITNTSISTSTNTGALQVNGGVGINGNTFINGALTINSVSGNLNFISSSVSTSYTSGSSYFVGGLGIQCSVPASSQYNGGALSVAGGFALGQNAMIGGMITIFSSNVSNSALSGCGVFYGGIGINGQTNIRSDYNSQIKIIPVTTGNETSIFFGNQNDYTTTGSWNIGQNTNGIGSGYFGISNANNGVYITLNPNNTINLNKYTTVLNTMNFFNNSLSDYITFNNTQNTTNWSIGRILNTSGDFQISRYTNGNYLNHLLTADTKTGNIFILGTENSNSFNSGGSLTILGGTSIQKDLYIGGNVFSGTITFTGNLQSNSSTDINVFSYLTLTATDNSINLTSGALVTFGGITIQASNDSVSTTNGGGLTIAGGASIYKSLFVGNTVNCTSIISNYGFIVNNTLSNIFNTNLNTVNSTTKNILATNVNIQNLNVNFQTIANSNVSNINNQNFNNLNSTIGQLNVSLITANSIIITTGNLSIQTSSFLPLSLSTLSTNSSRIELNQGTSSKAILGIDGSGYSNLELGTLMILTSTNNPIAFGTNNLRRMYLGTNGNFGINNTSPNYTIDVTGSARFSGSLLANFNSNTLGNLFTTGGNVGINSTAPSNSFEVLNGRISVRSNSTSIIQTLFESTIVTQGTFLFTEIDSKSYLYNQNITGGNNNPLVLQCLSNNTGLGNVGIGTNNPIFTLDINGTLRSSNTISIQNTVNNISNTVGSINFSSDIALSNNTKNTILFSQAGVAPPTFNTRSIGTKLVLYPIVNSSNLDYAIGVDNNTMWFSASSSFKWHLNSTTSNLQLTNTGLGINLSNNLSPNYALHIVGSTFITSGSFAATFNSNTLGNLFTTNGNIGINNTSPNFTLDIIGTLHASSSININGNSNTLGSLFTTNGSIGIQNTSPNKQLEISSISFSANQDNGLRISTKNYISISDPSYRYIDLRLKSDSTSNYRGSILGTLSGGIQTEYEYMSFSQDGFVNIYAQTRYLSNVPCSNSSTASVVLTGGLSINNFTNATSVSNGGSLTVAGGAAISGDLIVGGSIYYANAAAASSTFAYLTLTATDNSINIANGALVVFGGISIQCSTDATSSTQGNGMTIAGGLGVGASLYVGRNGYIPNVISQNYTTSNINAISSTLSNVLVTNGLNSQFNSNTIGNLYTTGGNIGINNTTPKFPLSITGTGAVLVITSGSTTNSMYQAFFSGNSQAYIGIDGIGFGGFNTGAMLISSWTNNPLILGTNQIQRMIINTSGNVGINNTNPQFTLDITGTLNIKSSIDSINSSTGTFTCSGGISISKTTNSSSVNNGGSLTIAGGAAIAKDLYIGGIFTSSSDYNLKTNFRHLNNSDVLDKIDSIQTLKYNEIKDIDKIDYIGFIAQDFKEYFPELLRKQTNSFYSLAYDRITVLNTACIKELKYQNKLLLQRIESLESIIKDIN